MSHFEQDELYDLRRDPNETRNICKTNPRIVNTRRGPMEAVLKQEHDITEDPRAKLAPHLLRQLQGLGYLKGSDDDKSAED